MTTIARAEALASVYRATALVERYEGETPAGFTALNALAAARDAIQALTSTASLPSRALEQLVTPRR